MAFENRQSLTGIDIMAVGGPRSTTTSPGIRAQQFIACRSQPNTGISRAARRLGFGEDTDRDLTTMMRERNRWRFA